MLRCLVSLFFFFIVEKRKRELLKASFLKGRRKRVSKLMSRAEKRREQSRGRWYLAVAVAVAAAAVTKNTFSYYLFNLIFFTRVPRQIEFQTRSGVPWKWTAPRPFHLLYYTGLVGCGWCYGNWMPSWSEIWTRGL